MSPLPTTSAGATMVLAGRPQLHCAVFTSPATLPFAHQSRSQPADHGQEIAASRSQTVDLGQKTTSSGAWAMHPSQQPLIRKS